jgi:uncharacterized protein (TIGR02646 family)
MKHIVKGPQPPELGRWNDENERDGAEVGWNQLSGESKDELKSSLLREQGYICCYCEKRISENICGPREDDTCSHIEHIKPRSNPSYQDHVFDYDNLLASCEGRRHLQQPARHCGNRKGGWYDEDLFISPLDPHCESSFIYTSAGEIKAAGNSGAAQETIKRLGLNIDKLIKLRKSVIDAVVEKEVGGEVPSPQAERESRRRRYEARDDLGKFQPFYSALMQVMGIYQLI